MGTKTQNINLDSPPPLILDISGIANHEAWNRYKDHLNLYFTASELTDKKRKHAILLYTGGEELRKIHSTLGDTGENYDTAITELDKYFCARVNLTVERHSFRAIVQEPGESIKSFATRLREAAASCKFDEYTMDEACLDQIIEKTSSTKLRRKLLTEDELTMTKALKLGCIMESTEQHAKSIEKNENETMNVLKNQSSNRSWNKPQFRKEFQQDYRKGMTMKDQSSYNQRKEQPTNSWRGTRFRCYGCGAPNHRIGSSDCPALGQTCKCCRRKDHFESECMRKRGGESVNNKPNEQLRKMEELQVESDSDDYIFNIGNRSQHDVRIKIEGQYVNFLRDSGASVNVIDKGTYEDLRRKVRLKLHPTSTKIFTYGSQQAIKLEGVIYANVENKGTHNLARLHITSSQESGCILGRELAVELGLMKMVDTVNSLQDSGLSSKIKEEYPELFQGLGKLKDTEIKFTVDKNIQPVSQHLRRIPFHVRKKVENKLKQLIELDIIEPVTEATSWVSPIVAIPKGEEIRLTIDMRKPNTAIKRNHFPIPTLDEILLKFNNCRVFTKLDLNNGYHQISLHPESRELTTFITHEGLFRYKRLVQGANSAFEEYQRLIGNLFSGESLIQNICDDILVAGRDEEEHDLTLRKCLNILQQNNLTLNERKCRWKVPEVTFYGHTISKEGIKAETSKVKAVKDFPSPRNSKEVSSFLGLVTYLTRFIRNLSTEAAPLRNLLQKDVCWRWGKEEEETFQKLKKLVTSSEVVAHFNPELDTSIIVDASKVGLGAILVQTQKDNVIKPVYYASRTLSKQERKYSQTEKEALSVIWACEKFHIFLYGKQFDILTDHQPLTVLYTHNGKPSPRILRWSLRLQSYEYNIKFIPGRLNPADMLSINPISATEKDIKDSEETEKYINRIISFSIPKAISLSETMKESEEDKVIKKVIENLNNNEWNKEDEATKPFYQCRDELCHKGGLLMKGERIVIPSKLRKRTLSLLHETHMGIVKTKALAREKVWWPRMYVEIEDMIKSCIPCLSMGDAKKEPMGFVDFPMSRPWEQLHVDLCGPYPTGEYVLGIIDAATRWPDLHIISDTKSAAIIKKLRTSFATHGYPEVIVTDNGSNLISAEMGRFCEENAIKHRKATPYHPQGNSEIERFYRTLGKFVKTTHAEGRCWKQELDNFLLLYRNTPHSTTTESPARLLMSRNLKDKIPTVMNEESTLMKKIRKVNAEKKMKSKEYYDKKNNVKHSDIKEGDKVLVRRIKKTKLKTKFEVAPATVTGRSGPTVIMNRDGVQLARNVKDVIKIPSEEEYDVEIEQENEVNEEEVEEEEAEENLPEVEAEGRPKRTAGLPAKLKDYILS